MSNHQVIDFKSFWYFLLHFVRQKNDLVIFDLKKKKNEMCYVIVVMRHLKFLMRPTVLSANAGSAPQALTFWGVGTLKD